MANAGQDRREGFAVLTMKNCRDCGVTRPLGDFYAHPRMADGHLNSCKECRKGFARKHRQANEHVRTLDAIRRQDPSRRAYQRNLAKAWNKANPLAEKAHRAVYNAVRYGRLEKAPCQICGSDQHIIAHHHDYTKPLDVTWLCQRCHARGHASGAIPSAIGKGAP